MSTFLSIDIDYWDGKKAIRQMTGFMKKVFDLDVPIQVKIDHHELLPFIKKSECRNIINVDAHSDLADFPQKSGSLRIKMDLNCGTWATHVPEKQKEKFIWIYPEKTCYEYEHCGVDGKYVTRGSGRCDMLKNPFLGNSKKLCGWEKIEKRLAKLPTNSELKEVSHVGICISPDYTAFSTMIKILEMLYDKGLITIRMFHKSLSLFLKTSGYDSSEIKMFEKSPYLRLNQKNKTYIVKKSIKPFLEKRYVTAN